ncbi:MAG TPA: topoisomerase DNA-binding C4 zinc finger domain-containing protein [Arsenophonus sp.]
MQKRIFLTKIKDEDKKHCPRCHSELIIRNGGYGLFVACSNYPKCKYVKPLKQSSDSQIIKELVGYFCPKCGHNLILKQGRFGMFIGCSHYPKCEHTELIDKPDKTLVVCPHCQDGELLQRTSRLGKIFYACNCYPKCQFVINSKSVSRICCFCHYPLLIEKKVSQDMKIVCANKLCNKPQ